MVEGGCQQNGKSSDNNDDNGSVVQRTDPMTDLGDCFVELYTNLKRPSVFFKSTTKNDDRRISIAKSYNILFE